MRTTLDPADLEFLGTLRRLGPRTVQGLGEALGVTATAIRQKLTRLQAFGHVERRLVREGRGGLITSTSSPTRRCGNSATITATWRRSVARGPADHGPDSKGVDPDRVRDAWWPDWVTSTANLSRSAWGSWSETCVRAGMTSRSTLSLAITCCGRTIALTTNWPTRTAGSASLSKRC